MFNLRGRGSVYFELVIECFSLYIFTDARRAFKIAFK